MPSGAWLLAELRKMNSPREEGQGPNRTERPFSTMKTIKVGRPPRFQLNQSVIFQGDALTSLRRMPDKSVQCIVTSPPYWGMRDYSIPDQIGLEPTLNQFLNSLRSVFAEARRVLRDDGLLWLNIGDGYTSGNRGWRAPDKKNRARAMAVRPDTPDGLKPKDLLGVLWLSHCRRMAGTFEPTSFGTSPTQCRKASRTGQRVRMSMSSCSASQNGTTTIESQFLRKKVEIAGLSGTFILKELQAPILRRFRQS